MPSTLLKEAVFAVSEDKEWPDGVLLYKNLCDQELLPEVAKYHAVEALLAVHDLQGQYKTCRKDNAEYMSPKGVLPFLRIGNQIEAEESILAYLDKRGYSLSSGLAPEIQIQVKGILSLIKTRLVPIELYYTWVDEKNRKQTFSKYGFNQPEPLRKILCWKKQKDMATYLDHIGWLKKTPAEILAAAVELFEFFTNKLANGSCLVNNQLTEADVYLYGHLQAILESNQKSDILRNTLTQYPKLTQFCLTFNQVHLGDRSMLWEFV